MSTYFYPKLQAVAALEPYRLRTTWSTGEVLDVDVGATLRKYAALTPILEPEVFARVHLAEWGGGIEWFETELGPDNVYAWAQEQAGAVSHQMFGDWMLRNALSLQSAAQALGISRRMVSYYRTAHKAIPRSIWLACLGWEATRPHAQALPRRLPTAREYAVAHA
ncbi:dehydrogenase with different specificities related to short-chain alcohol dehydrogenase [Serpentinimonas maccroryi]|uniref:Dehydrogenase with different specificities related to short-chain alcohol dehydrogenase n=1 Tax=Serpentinimonas maccroryi TaxID=1458426 RepID=A0A060NRT0_9BURK|nr:DUF2442 domain-containing protein [Serpentinimonas maccroryi]BAO84070.1 dehydrogenase with different specificities related to short-chain alcohol dehydrogenase [Serpentinimonas maccroryi]